MQKRVYMMLLALVAAIAVTSCTGKPAPSIEPTDATESPSAELSSMPSIAPITSIIPASSPSPSTASTPEPMSYEEYFSELRPIMDRELRFEKWDYEDETQSIYRASDHKLVVTGVLTRWDFCMANDEESLAYCVDGSKVYLYNGRTDESELLYESDGEKIEFLDGGGPVVFFDVGQKIYRIYLPDRTLDFICDRSYTSKYNEQSRVWVGEENSFYFDAISNTDVCFSVIDAGWYVDDAAAVEMELGEYCSRKFESQEAGPAFVWYSSILGKYICGERVRQTLGLSEDEVIEDAHWYVYEYLEGIEAILA